MGMTNAHPRAFSLILTWQLFQQCKRLQASGHHGNDLEDVVERKVLEYMRSDAHIAAMEKVGLTQEDAEARGYIPIQISRARRMFGKQESRLEVTITIAGMPRYYAEMLPLVEPDASIQNSFYNQRPEAVVQYCFEARLAQIEEEPIHALQ